jgi:hypothetical protein
VPAAKGRYKTQLDYRDGTSIIPLKTREKHRSRSSFEGFEGSSVRYNRSPSGNRLVPPIWRTGLSDFLGLLRHWSVALLVFVSMISTGCTSKSLPPPPLLATEAYPFGAESNGLKVAVEPWFDGAKVERHFGENFLSYGILPVRVFVVNGRTEGAYLLQPESVALLEGKGAVPAGSASGLDLTSEHAKAVGAASVIMQVTMLASPLMALGPGLVGSLYAARLRDAQEAANRMEYVRFQDRPLYPSDSNTGFLFFHLSEAKDLERVGGLRFQLQNLRTREVFTVVVDIATH